MTTPVKLTTLCNLSPNSFLALLLHTPESAVPTKSTSVFGSNVTHTGHRSGINGRRLFQLQSLQDDLQAHPHGQDHRPEITLSAMGATAFLETWELGTQLLLMEPKQVIFSWVADQFLREGKCDDLTLAEMWGWTWPL
jgi:hypothetical protein